MKIKLDKGAKMLADPDWYNCECPICGKAFHLKPSALAKIKNKPCCSYECSAKYRSTTLMAGENNHQYGLKGNLNPTWKSDRKLSKFGYWQIRCLDHPFRDKQNFVFEHRLVAEQYLLNDENSVEIDGKKYLSPDYVVHHIDFNRLNNDVSNLIVMTKHDHRSFHAKLNPQNIDPKTGQFVQNTDILKAKRITPTAILPKRVTEGSACYDLYPDISESVTIPPHGDVILQTNIAMSFPKEYCGLIFARSGVSTKRHLRPSTCVSVIDNDYRGGVGLPVHNDSNAEQVVCPGERIAQLMLVKPHTPNIELVEELDETERGSRGFGSSGK